MVPSSIFDYYRQHSALTHDDIAFLDKVAEVTTHADTQFGELRTLFEELEYGQEVRTKLSVAV